MTDQIVRRAKAKGAAEPVVFRYKDAGHAAMGAPFADAAAAKKWSKLGGTAEGNSAARIDSWPKIVAFLKAELAPDSDR
jgi:hypothetical protein